jgi:hypothetical protein
MGIVMTWDNREKTIIKATVAAPFTWDELFSTWDSTVKMIREESHPVHMIVISQSSGFPPGNALAQLNRISTNVPPNLGLAIMVTTNRFIGLINSTLFKLSPSFSRRGRVVSSLEEAYRLIAVEGAPIPN